MLAECGAAACCGRPEAPVGWTVAVDKSWCTPPADDANTPTSNQVEYVWFNNYNAGTQFIVVYKVTVPTDVPLGNYAFTGSVGYKIGGGDTIQVVIGGDWQIQVIQGSPVRGLTYEVKGLALSNVVVTLIKGGLAIATAISDSQGNYMIAAPETGDYTLCASKAGFRDETHPISVTALGQEYMLNFKGKQGLIPNAPDIWYLLDCAAHWKYQCPDPELRLDIWKLLNVAAAWKYPIR